MEKLEKEAALKIDFFGKEFIFERLNPFTIRITSGASQSLASFSGELFVNMKKDFYEKPYFIKFKDNLYLPPKSQFKFFLRLPLATNLVLEKGKRSLQIDRHIEYTRMAWYGEVHRGVLCTYVEAEFEFNPFKTEDALVPLRIVNKSDIPSEISKVVLEPENISLIKGDNGMFTNKVYIHILSSNEISLEYGTETTSKVINPKIIIDRKISAKTVLARFDRLGIARELGL